MPIQAPLSIVLPAMPAHASAYLYVCKHKHARARGACARLHQSAALPLASSRPPPASRTPHARAPCAALGAWHRLSPPVPSPTLPGARVGTTVVGALACAARVRRLDRCQWARHQRFRVGSAAPALRSARHVVRDHLRRHRAERSRLLPDATRRQAGGSGGGRGVCVCWLPRQVYPALQRRRTGCHRLYLYPQ